MPGLRAIRGGLEPVRLDGRSLTPAGVAAVACDGAPAEMTSEAFERNRAAARAAADILARGDPIYGVTTGVGVLRTRGVSPDQREDMQLRLLRSHAGGGGSLLHRDEVRAAMVVRANQIGAGGAGVSDSLLRSLVSALNAGLAPAARELGPLGTGDVTVLAEIALALLGEGAVLDGTSTSPASRALARAGLPPPQLGVRDGIGFMSSNAATIGRAALAAVRAARVLDRALEVAALSFLAADADLGALDERVHAARPHREQGEVAARMRALTGRGPRRSREGRPVHDPYAFRCQPQVDGPAQAALARLGEVLSVELNAAAENALLVAADEVALPNGNFHAGVLGLALDNLCAALSLSGSLAAARVGVLLDPTVTGLPAMLAERPGADSGAMVLEYTAHAAAGELRALAAAPSSAGYASVSAGVEAAAGLTTHGAARAGAAVERMADVVAVELVTAVRALRIGSRTVPPHAGARTLLDAAGEALSDTLGDRPLSGDVAAARRLVLPEDISRTRG